MTIPISKDCKRQLDSHCHRKGDVWLVSDLCRYYSLCFYISIILIILLQALKWLLQQRMYLPCKVLSWHADWRVLISWCFTASMNIDWPGFITWTSTIKNLCVFTQCLKWHLYMVWWKAEQRDLPMINLPKWGQMLWISRIHKSTSKSLDQAIQCIITFSLHKPCYYLHVARTSMNCL